ncbi:hypothetical protein JW998_15110 [candidate division KSB1 bacterium]|nr:hypothetical protein [candidate division KSB1 bacterium]
MDAVIRMPSSFCVHPRNEYFNGVLGAALGRSRKAKTAEGAEKNKDLVSYSIVLSRFDFLGAFLRSRISQPGVDFLSTWQKLTFYRNCKTSVSGKID